MEGRRAIEEHSRGEVRGEARGDRLGPRLVGAGALLLAVQNGLLFLAFLIALGVDTPSGFAWAGIALLLDMPGMALVGVGLLRMGAQAEGRMRSVGGLLCFAWVGLTLLWRWILPALEGRGFEDLLLATWGSDGAAPADRIRAGGYVFGMLGAWIAASAALVAVPLSLRTRTGWTVGARLLGDRIDPRSWEGFAAMNAAGTFLVAGSLLAILAGLTVGWPLQAGIVMKIVFVPSSGAFAYAGLARRALRFVPSGPEPSVVSPASEPSGGDPDGPTSGGR